MGEWITVHLDCQVSRIQIVLELFSNYPLWNQEFLLDGMVMVKQPKFMAICCLSNGVA